MLKYKDDENFLNTMQKIVETMTNQSLSELTTNVQKAVNERKTTDTEQFIRDQCGLNI